MLDQTKYISHDALKYSKGSFFVFIFIKLYLLALPTLLMLCESI